MTIYQIYNKENGKSYIGQTCDKFGRRKAVHKYTLRKNKHANVHLQRSWNKYGEDSFEFHILDSCDNLKALNNREQLWIDVLGTLNNDLGYNIRSGGNNDRHSSETIKKLKKINRKPIIQLNEDGTILNYFNSLTEASKETGVSITNISSCLNGYMNSNGYTQKTAGGFKWKFQ